MRNISARLFQYELSLLPPFESKKGLLLQLIQPSGISSWGDIAPLEGWSKETFEQALEQVSFLKRLLFSKESETLTAEMNFFNQLHPSVAFGFESAFSTLFLRDRNLNLQVPLCALMTGSKEQILQQAKQAATDGYTFVKLKVGDLPFAEATDLVKTFKESFKLRIDVNRAWPLEQVQEFFAQFTLGTFDYVEEPVQESKDLASFSHPFGLDETLREQPIDNFLTLPKFKAAVIKPTLTGGLTRLRPYVRKMQNTSVRIVLSSAFESGVGIAQIAYLTKQLPIPPVPIGLDTYRYVKEDILEKRLVMDKGVFHLHQFPTPDLGKLTEIGHE